MIVEEIMQKDVKTLSPRHTVQDALKLMQKEQIRHIPLLDQNGKLCGVVTERDIKEVAPNPFFPGEQLEKLSLPLEKIMKTDLLTGHPLDFIEDIAALMNDNRIGCLPILENGQLAGIVTGTDLLQTFVDLTGAGHPSSQIEIRARNRTGILRDITEIIYEHHLNILSVLIYPDRKNEENRVLVFRVSTMNPVSLITHLKEAGYEVLWPNMPGMPR
ncbi:MULTISPECIES: acetoin utilization AcuB family protein [Heyndrickxia]|uniref:CBS domain containing membrane protein n=2 Tax=Heyndrickxia coagulans TaxID=1398 RepID=G2TND1_HEYCO|nr:acetoin utilization AcuB family protein [Heyndrickxia coagulans]AEP01640.1 CBS domain containing membrane protein [Heyndrickxia coagulans 36D1]MBF8418556.1 acetoin utilization AcuB family protein [Heyndrickxia coagulans]MDL5041337.1 acetoin utilization AcuB family protein [Heyndrickxia coagulans]MDT9756512.1 acetoin utilization AcuB family protein [Heyndrickxia coagulans]MED4313118.1 acetoin utilization AcuB family protein [Heyndrickxia coagulans]